MPTQWHSRHVGASLKCTVLGLTQTCWIRIFTLPCSSAQWRLRSTVFAWISPSGLSYIVSYVVSPGSSQVFRGETKCSKSSREVPFNLGGDLGPAIEPLTHHRSVTLPPSISADALNPMTQKPLFPFASALNVQSRPTWTSVRIAPESCAQRALLEWERRAEKVREFARRNCTRGWEQPYLPFSFLSVARRTVQTLILGSLLSLLCPQDEWL